MRHSFGQVNGPMSTTTVVTWSAPDKLGEAMRRSLPRLAPGVRAEVEKLLTPEALAVIAGVLGLWVGSHFIGIGEIIDTACRRCARDWTGGVRRRR